MPVPQPSFGPNGFIAPDESDILIAVKEEINAAFGNTLNMADETPQGQIAVSQTAAIGNANDSFVFLSQMFDPAFNMGRYQDAIARIYFLSRLGSLPTTVVCSLGGLPGVVIPAGSLALDQSGNIYVCTGDATIDSTGVTTATFANSTQGPVPCPAGTLTVIYQAINGWDSITNPGEGVLGRNEETRAQFEARRFASVANNAQGYLAAIRGKIRQLPGVLDCYVTENVNNSPQTIGGFTLGPKSLYAAVVGGDDADIAQTIWNKKAPGCGYNGNTTVTVLDQNSGYNPPFPSYQVSFERPSGLSILFKVNIQNNPMIPANAVALIQQAIINAFAGEDGGPIATIGAEIFASRFYAPIVAIGSNWALVRNIKIGSNQSADAVATGSISGTTLTISAMTSGFILVDGTVSGTNVLDGTRITNQIGGTPGGVGTYGLNQTQTVVSTTLTMASPLSDTIVPNIDKSPTVTAQNIEVVIA